MSYFQPPPIIMTEVFARLPDHLRRPHRSYWDVNQPGRTRDSFLEGPSFDREGRLYVVDGGNGRILRVGVDGEWTVVTEYDGAPNGLKVHRDGHIVVADSRRGILLLDADSGTITPLLERAADGFRGVNDLFFAANGDLYFTDQGQSGLHDPSGRLYRLSANGTVSLLLSNIPSPNGLVVTPDGLTLYLAVTRANQIWKVPLHESGMMLKVSVFAYLHGGPAGPDGLALDEEGSLYVAHAGFGAVWQLSSLAEPKLRLQTCVDGLLTTNVAFGGHRNRWLYITESATGSILRAQVPCSGERMFSHD